MKFAKIVYLIAGVYGVLVLAPMYFTEAQQARPIENPAFYYGFIGVALAWQFAFLVIATDPAKFRPLMFVSLLEKLGFIIPAIVLYTQNRITPNLVAAAGLDGLLLLLFIGAIIATAPKTKTESPSQ